MLEEVSADTSGGDGGYVGIQTQMSPADHLLKEPPDMFNAGGTVLKLPGAKMPIHAAVALHVFQTQMIRFQAVHDEFLAFINIFRLGKQFRQRRPMFGHLAVGAAANQGPDNARELIRLLPGT